MKIDPRHLEIIAAVVDQGGLTEGATLLGKSQPSVSRSLSMLERRLGINLFQPGRRPLQPTQTCLLLAHEGRKILQAGEAASGVVLHYQRGTNGAVRLAGPPIFMEGVVSGMLASFQSSFPDIRIDQSYCYAAEVFARIESDALDLGIVPVRASEVPDSLIAKQILKGRNVVACRVGHPIARKQAVRLAEIAQFPWIAPPADSPLFHDLRTALESIGVSDIKVGFTGASLSAVINILEGSDALTVLPYSVVFMLRRKKTVDALSIRIGDPDRHLCIVSRRNEVPSPATRRLASFVESEFASFNLLIDRHEQNVVWRS
ncbi:LysR family transcriptional regulator [Ruegeria arenilitoris]|uniref:LysR family transcriptional regulator n=1 Tax=Ruegeria arenilitoris TaxID=1173585 RepID=UPI001479A3D2|nr:LysR family transcriptional regulator [Ruegeria arenilitoris]